MRQVWKTIAIIITVLTLALAPATLSTAQTIEIESGQMVTIETHKISEGKTIITISTREPSPAQIMAEMLEYIAYQEQYLRAWSELDKAMNNEINSHTVPNTN